MLVKKAFASWRWVERVWLGVGLPLIWGIYNTLLKLPTLFR
ncbi:MAG TPA: hypothetical protein VGF73_12165 [Chthoniobacterales bacterium]|jgi:hypothetical protein